MTEQELQKIKNMLTIVVSNWDTEISIQDNKVYAVVDGIEINIEKKLDIHISELLAKVKDVGLNYTYDPDNHAIIFDLDEILDYLEETNEEVLDGLTIMEITEIVIKFLEKYSQYYLIKGEK